MSELTGGSDYFQQTFKMVVEHIHRMILDHGRRRRHASIALEFLLVLVRKTAFPLVDAIWINGLLKRAAVEKMADDTFTLLLRLSAWRKEEDDATDDEYPFGQDYVHVHRRETDPQTPGGTTTSEISTLGYTLLTTILRNLRTCTEQNEGWEDEAVYGGLVAIRDIHGVGTGFPEVGFLETLSDAMEKSKPLRVRKAAYDVIRAAQDGWLRSPDLRWTFQKFDLPRHMYKVVIETGRPGHKLSFLKTMEILSEDRYWHSYLRGAMDIWLAFYDEGPRRAIRILARVGEMLFPEDDNPNFPFDKPLVKVVEDEWARVPGRQAIHLSIGLLEPLVEVTIQLKGLFFTDGDREVVLAVVERVIPSLERRRDGYEGPGEDIRYIIGGLLEVLRVPTQSTASC